MREAKLEADVIFSYSAGICACEQGDQWQRALAVLSEMWEAQLKPDAISFNSGISAYGKGVQWKRALALLSEMRETKLEPNVISYSAGISACEKSERWQRALSLLGEMREAKLELNVIAPNLQVPVRARRVSASTNPSEPPDIRMSPEIGPGVSRSRHGGPARNAAEASSAALFLDGPVSA
ncbi:unnamed protein product [Prorocentrum cordatum]|uniref:Uncharacterized protein n=1 Tax=Prorocentrum cordatum TaxID=2364126 RepID=A0ABN9WXY0_9DINO|nr:unnamed protein product [Polarella glacialis]